MTSPSSYNQQEKQVEIAGNNILFHLSHNCLGYTANSQLLCTQIFHNNKFSRIEKVDLEYLLSTKFDSRQSAKDALDKYAIVYENTTYSYSRSDKKNGSSRTTYECSKCQQKKFKIVNKAETAYFEIHEHFNDDNKLHLQTCSQTKACVKGKQFQSKNIVKMSPVVNYVLHTDVSSIKQFKSFIESQFNIKWDYDDSVTSRLLTACIDHVETEVEDCDYSILPHFLMLLGIINPTMKIQLDCISQERKFVRMFVCVPNAKSIFANGCLQLLSIDATYCTSSTWDGCFVYVVSKSAHGKTIPLAFAAIPSENVRDLVWIMEKLAVSGLPLHQVPLFTDRGNLLHACAVLLGKGIVLNLKFCIEHIIRNINSRLKLKQSDDASITKVRFFVNALQKCSSAEEYFGLCIKIFHFNEDMMLYISQIHPTMWTVYGNLPGFNDYQHRSQMAKEFQSLGLDIDINEHLSTNVPVGNKTPLFLHSRTNISESENSTTKINGMRNLSPPRALVLFMSRFDDIMSNAHDYVNTFNNTPNLKLSTIGYTLLRDAEAKLKTMSGIITSIKKMNDHIHFEFRHSLLDGIKSIIMWNGSRIFCTCDRYQMCQSVCICILSVLSSKECLAAMDMKLQDTSKVIMDVFGQYYHLENNFAVYDSLKNNIRYPESILKFEDIQDVKRPYSFRQTKQKKRRIQSRGELSSKFPSQKKKRRRMKYHNESNLMSPPTCKMESLAAALSVSSKDSLLEIDSKSGTCANDTVGTDEQVDMADSEKILKNMLDPNSRTSRKCSFCGEYNHYISSCTTKKLKLSGGYMKPTDINNIETIVKCGFESEQSKSKPLSSATDEMVLIHDDSFLYNLVFEEGIDSKREENCLQTYTNNGPSEKDASVVQTDLGSLDLPDDSQEDNTENNSKDLFVTDINSTFSEAENETNINMMKNNYFAIKATAEIASNSTNNKLQAGDEIVFNHYSFGTRRETIIEVHAPQSYFLDDDEFGTHTTLKLSSPFVSIDNTHVVTLVKKYGEEEDLPANLQCTARVDQFQLEFSRLKGEDLESTKINVEEVLRRNEERIEGFWKNENEKGDEDSQVDNDEFLYIPWSFQYKGLSVSNTCPVDSFMSLYLNIVHLQTTRKLEEMSSRTGKLSRYYELLRRGDHEEMRAQIYADGCHEYVQGTKKKKDRIRNLFLEATKMEKYQRLENEASLDCYGRTQGMEEFFLPRSCKMRIQILHQCEKCKVNWCQRDRADRFAIEKLNGKGDLLTAFEDLFRWKPMTCGQKCPKCDSTNLYSRYHMAEPPKLLILRRDLHDAAKRIHGLHNVMKDDDIIDLNCGNSVLTLKGLIGVSSSHFISCIRNDDKWFVMDGLKKMVLPSTSSDLKNLSDYNCQDYVYEVKKTLSIDGYTWFHDVKIEAILKGGYDELNENNTIRYGTRHRRDRKSL